jgi:hypothetical protein
MCYGSREHSFLKQTVVLHFGLCRFVMYHNAVNNIRVLFYAWLHNLLPGEARHFLCPVVVHPAVGCSGILTSISSSFSCLLFW